MFKFLHTADIHLDSPLLNLDRYDGAPHAALRGATRQAFDNIVALAIQQQVDFVLIAGDLYDGDCKDFNTPLHLRRKMHELGTHGIRVFIIQGNHDAASKMKKAFRLQLPDNVHLLGTTRPETIRIEQLQCAIHGQGFAQREVTEDLSAGYPDPLAGWFNIGMLHSSCGAYEAHARYAPSTPVGLTSKGYNYWALGHIHKRETLTGPNPMIVYPGNPQGRHIREQGEKGCIIATVEEDRVRTRFHAVDVLRWQTCAVDASDCTSPDEVINAAQQSIQTLLGDASNRPLAVRVEVSGSTTAHRELLRHADLWDRKLREETVDRFDDRVWIEKIQFRTQSAGAPRDAADTALDELLAGIGDPGLAEHALAELRTDFEKMLEFLPTDPRLADAVPNYGDQPFTSDLLRAAKDLLEGRL